jgi:hypothetical protein
MPNEHRSAGQRRVAKSRTARIAVPLAIPMALALTLGIIFAVSGHGVSAISESALGSCNAPAASPAADVSSVAAGTNPGPGTNQAGNQAPDTNQATNPDTNQAPDANQATNQGTDPGTNQGANPAPETNQATGTNQATDPGTNQATDPATNQASPTAPDTNQSTDPGTDQATDPGTSQASPTAPASGTGQGSAPASDPASPCPSGSASASAPAAAANVNCDIIVPANPLSAQGLATPYQLTGPDGMSAAASGCTMTNAAALGAFVQATILNTRTGALSVYDPLVITQGTTPAVAPVVPVLPRHRIVTIDFGFNGTDLTQVGATPDALAQGNCVNGEPGSIFGQVSFCNGVSFFQAAFAMEFEGRLHVPFEGTSAKIVPTGGAIGTGTDCPVVRNFDMVDQDPSDNVTTEYLLDPATGQTAQDTTSNLGNLNGATVLLNGSDNTLLDGFIDPVLGCTPFQVPDLANNDQPTSSQALDELLAAKNQPAVAALVPENDEMTLDGNGQFDAAKTDLYRAEVGQPPVSNQNNQTSSPQNYCQNMINIQTPFLAANQTLLATGQPPVAGVGNNLFTFMANRLSMSFTNLACQNFGFTNPVTVTLDGNGVATAATLNTTPQSPTMNGTPSTPGSGTPGSHHHHRRGRNHHRYMNPSGM